MGLVQYDRVSGTMTIKAGNIKKNSYILFKNQPYLVTKTDFMSPGKGSAVMRAKLRNVKTGFSQEYTFKSTENIEEVEVSTRELQYLYADESEVVFMDQRSYEQVSVDRALVDDQVDLLTSEAVVYVVFYDEKAIGVHLPPKVTLKITYSEESTAGNTVGQARKQAEVETGLKVMVPLFVKTGDNIIIDTTTKEYVSRAN
jgi:elongation factor P